MVELELRYFASVREAIGLATERISTHSRTVDELRNELVARGGGYASSLAADRPIRAAIDHQMVAFSDALPATNGAEVAFFPPVTGG